MNSMKKCRDSITGVHVVNSTNNKERSTCVIFVGTIAVYFTENNNVVLRTLHQIMDSAASINIFIQAP